MHITVNQIVVAVKTMVGDKPFTNDNVERALTDEATRRLHGDRANSLDWRHSIVDLLKILNIDSSWETRIGLAESMGYTGAMTKEESFAMNVWMLREIFNQIANSYETS